MFYTILFHHTHILSHTCTDAHTQTLLHTHTHTVSFINFRKFFHNNNKYNLSVLIRFVSKTFKEVKSRTGRRQSNKFIMEPLSHLSVKMVFRISCRIFEKEIPYIDSLNQELHLVV